jgi:uncharacterized protein (UPF0332 family)
MDSMVEIFMERSDNEVLAAESLKKLSEMIKTKGDFKLPKETTFYSSVISHSYYAIFYATKAILFTKGIKTFAPEIHKKTYESFEEYFVKTGLLDRKLLEIYNDLMLKASDLLEIFKDEKWKRGNFTYNTISQANKLPADESLNNAKLFVSSIKRIVGI